MSFRAALQATPGLQNAYCPGLQALRAEDRARIRAANARSLAGSADIDAALGTAYANAARWDYAIAHRAHHPPGERVYWVEVHSAHTGDVGAVLAKLNWLKSWLSGAAPLLAVLPREFVWLATGPVHILAGSPQARRLAQSGLRPPQGQLTLP